MQFSTTIPHFLTIGGNGLANRLYYAYAIPHGCLAFYNATS